MAGRDRVLFVGFILSLLAFLLLLVAYITPYWVVSWPRVYSQFKRIGMWEACFAGLILERDPTQKAYHGCWWVLSPEYWAIREWLMPWWFILCQILTTLSLVTEIIGLFLMVSLMNRSDKSKRMPWNFVNGSTWIALITSFVAAWVVIMFALGFYLDHRWMPRPDLNYMSWSYGLVILSTFFSIGASIAMVMYRKLIRQEYREAPSLEHHQVRNPLSSIRDMM